MAASTTLARPTGRLEGLRALLRSNPALLPALLAVAIFVALAASEAGFYPIGSALHPGLGWYPAAILLLALLAAAAIAVPPRGVPRPVLAALALLAGYTAWSFLSITWAEQQGVAWDGANRTAIYLVVFALFALWPLTAAGAQVVLGALGLGLAGLGLVELLRADAAAEPALFFVDARLAEPAGYINANVAVWTLGLLLCLQLAIVRRANPLLRGLALGGAGILGCLALLGQSRGWVIAVPVAALLFVALTPHRARALAAVAAITLGVSAISGSLLAVHDNFTDASLDGLLADATGRVLALAALLAVAGFAAAVVDRRVTLSAARSRGIDRASAIGLPALLATAAVAAAVAVGSPVDKASDAWESFKRGGEGTGAGDSRFASVGTNRYDFWAVALERFRDRPLVGIGSENFQQDYLASGNSGEQPRYPHSLPIGVLSQTGIVGGLLLGGALLSAAFAAIWRRRRTTVEAALAAAAGTAFAYWLLHASVDWFWEFPGVTAPAFAALGVAVAVGRRERSGEREQRPGKSRITPMAGFAVTGTALLVSLALPWLAEREVEHAASGWASSPRLAFERLDRAARLNPLTPRPHLVAGAIAVRIEDEARAAAAFEEVLEHEPRTPFALAQLAALASERGQGDRALRLLERAGAYAPNDEVVAMALERLRSGGRIEVRNLNARYLEQARGRVGRD